MTEKHIGIGLIGCGGFGLFCAEAYSQLPQVRLAAVADVRAEAADACGKQFNVPHFTEAQELIDHGEVDLVHIATPPSSHYDLVMRCASARKHVLCEKPLAMTVAQGTEMLDACSSAGVICPVNFVLRYNRVTDAVSEVLRSGALGAPLAARLNNCASDSKLGPEHWFWRPEVSGGIFIEHGVHFFDLYRHWLACEGHVRCAYAEKRPVGGMEDRVGCLVRHENGAIVSHYHGFDQVGAMDRTDHRIICELGDIRVEGWIPLRMEIDAAVDESALAQLLAISGQNDAHTAPLAAGETRGRGRDWPIDRQARLEYFPLKDKQEVYASSVRDLLADQLAYIVDRGHQRRITELNGLEALKLAGAAREMAARG